MIMNIFSTPKLFKRIISFVFPLILFIGIYFLMGYNKITTKGPYSRHTYRQSDSYAFALNYYHENNNFFEPAILTVIEDKGGKTVSEFPILYYITAQIWKITGVNPFIPKLLNLIILYIGLFYLYKLSNEILQDKYWSIIVSLFMFSSPLLGYYGFNYIPNTPALGIALIASFFYYKYHKESNKQDLTISTILFSLAALIKVSSLFAFLAINFVFFIYNIRNRKQDHKALYNQIISGIALFSILLGWFIFSRIYNSNNLDGLFRQDIIPIWKLAPEHIQKILNVVYTNTIIYFFNPIALLLLGVLLIISVIFRKETNQKMLYITLTILLGMTVFVLLFFEGMDEHEYFLIDTTIIIPAIVITFLTTLKGKFPKIYYSSIFKTATFILVLFSLNYSMVLTRAHYNPKDKLVTSNFPLPKRVVDYWEWVHWDYEIHKGKFEGIVPYLRSLGIKFEDKVISVPDESPNITLSLMQQKGFTDYHYSNHYQGRQITERKIELGAKYLIVEGEENLHRSDVAPFIKNQIGEYNGIKIFKLMDNSTDD